MACCAITWFVGAVGVAVVGAMSGSVVAFSVAVGVGHFVFTIVAINVAVGVFAMSSAAVG